jgi:hypothetical protein
MHNGWQQGAGRKVLHAHSGIRSRFYFDMSKQPISTFERPQFDRWLDQADDYARREPIKAVACAFGAGFFMNLLPIGTIVGALTGVVFMMLRPFLLFLGLLKACELWKGRSQ